MRRQRSRPAIDSAAARLPATRHEAVKFARPLRGRAASRAENGDRGLASLQRQRVQQPAVDLGDEDPLYTRNLANGPPDRRRVSLRWLAGSVLTGIFSVGLVGGALQAAIGLDEYLDRAPGARPRHRVRRRRRVADKGDRFRPVPESEGDAPRHPDLHRHARGRPRHRARAPVRACAHQPRRAGRGGGRGARPRLQAARHLRRRRRARSRRTVAASDSIYGAEVDGEVAIKVVDFPLDRRRL